MQKESWHKGQQKIKKFLPNNYFIITTKNYTSFHRDLVNVFPFVASFQITRPAFLPTGRGTRGIQSSCQYACQHFLTFTTTATVPATHAKSCVSILGLKFACFIIADLYNVCIYMMCFPLSTNMSHFCIVTHMSSIMPMAVQSCKILDLSLSKK